MSALLVEVGILSSLGGVRVVPIATQATPVHLSSAMLCAPLQEAEVQELREVVQVLEEEVTSLRYALLLLYCEEQE